MCVPAIKISDCHLGLIETYDSIEDLRVVDMALRGAHPRRRLEVVLADLQDTGLPLEVSSKSLNTMTWGCNS